VDYLKLLLDDSITEDIVERTTACIRILRERAKNISKQLSKTCVKKKF